ncbi:hypothetical protein GGR56DRAFT_611503, partial [Xylariaceae sp. FL0804]
MKHPNLWKWFFIDSDMAGFNWRLVDGYEDVHRLVFVRKESRSGFQGCFSLCKMRKSLMQRSAQEVPGIP